jgi:hypothetical protein
VALVVLGLAPTATAQGAWSTTVFEDLVPEDIPDPEDRNVVCSLDDGTTYTYVFTDGAVLYTVDTLTVGGATLQERTHADLVEVVGGLFVNGTVDDPSLHFEGWIEFTVLYDAQTGDERLIIARAKADVIDSAGDVIDRVDFIELDNMMNGRKVSRSLHGANCG